MHQWTVLNWILLNARDFLCETGGLKKKSIMLGKRNPLHIFLISHSRIWWISILQLDQTCKIGFDPSLVLYIFQKQLHSRLSKVFNFEWSPRSPFQSASFLHYVQCLSNGAYSKSPWNYPERAPFTRIGKGSSNWLASTLVWAFKIYISKWNQA